MKFVYGIIFVAALMVSSDAQQDNEIQKTEHDMGCEKISLRKELKNIQGMVMKWMEEKKKMKMENKFGCLEASKGPKKMNHQAMNGMECLITETMEILLRTCLKGDSPTTKEKKDIWMAVQNCTLKYSKDEIVFANGTMNFKNFSKSLSKKGDGADAQILLDFSNRCIRDEEAKAKGKNISGEESLSGYMHCFFGKVIGECRTRGDSPGKMIVVAYMANSYYKEKCTSAKIPKDFTDKIIKCQDLALDDLGKDMEKALAHIMSMGGKAPEDIVADIFKLIRWAKESGTDKLLSFYKKLCECFLGEMKWLVEFEDEKTKTKHVMYNATEAIEYFKNKLGWSKEEIQQRDEVVSAMEECYGGMFGKGEQKGLVKLEDTAKLSFMKEFKKQMWDCFLPRFVSTCGMNNKVVEFIMHLKNKEVADRFLNRIKNMIMSIKKAMKEKMETKMSKMKN